jgi:hypothetical protein
MNAFWVGILLGALIGYILCDLLTKESSIVYHIKRLRAKEGSVINVEAEAVLSRKEKRKQRRKSQKTK